MVHMPIPQKYASTVSFDEIINEVRQCSRCADHMHHNPRPIIRGFPTATILIVGQALGLKAHETGLSFNDPSGKRLRAWLEVDRNEFYDESKIAIMPVGLCFPGRNKTGGDLPPLKVCAPLWHQRLLPFFPNIKLTILVGSYAQKLYFKRGMKISLTDTVRAFEEYLPQYFPLPHPSWRNTAWIKRHPWFESILLPRLRKIIRENML